MALFISFVQLGGAEEFTYRMRIIHGYLDRQPEPNRRL